QGHHLPCGDELTFVDPDLLEPAGYARGNVDLDRLDATVGADQSLFLFLRPISLPGESRQRAYHQNPDNTDQPFLLLLGHRHDFGTRTSGKGWNLHLAGPTGRLGNRRPLYDAHHTILSH